MGGIKMIVVFYDKLKNKSATEEAVTTFFDSGRAYTIYFSSKDPDDYATYPKHRYDLCYVSGC